MSYTATGIGHVGLGVTYSFPESTTRAAQTEYNAWAKKHGYCPIGTDGKLGPATCGALRVYRDESGFGGATVIPGGVPGECKSFTTPRKQPCTSAAPAPSPLPAAPALPPPKIRRGMSSEMKAVLIGGGLAALGVGGYYVWRKVKR